MSSKIKKIRLEFFHENTPFTQLISPELYVFLSPDINSSNLDQFLKKSKQINNLKARISKLKIESTKNNVDSNRISIYTSNIKDLYKTLNNLLSVFDIEEGTWDNINGKSNYDIFKSEELVRAFYTFLTTSNPVTKKTRDANINYVVDLFTRSGDAKKNFIYNKTDNYRIASFKIIEDSFQRLEQEYVISLDIKFKKIVDRQEIQFKIKFTGDIATTNLVDFKPQYSIKSLPSQYSKIYFDKRIAFTKDQLTGFSKILARIKTSNPLEYEKFKDFKDIKEIFVNDKYFDKFIEDRKIIGKIDDPKIIANNIALISKVFFDPDFLSGFFSKKQPLYFYYNGKQYQIINYDVSNVQFNQNRRGAYQANVILHILGTDTPITRFRITKSLCPMKIAEVNRLSRDLGLQDLIQFDTDKSKKFDYSKFTALNGGSKIRIRKTKQYKKPNKSKKSKKLKKTKKIKKSKK